ncbi:unnamed protein product [Ranitomeya imitator]|uniref:Sushi domain-containing protein n=1 Tax=Ranitomeya imitator TaxID=111125 RepID=A0ABN9L0V1_9NEOB|nr:unnamed protein product [Ranitomeya imitator]
MEIFSGDYFGVGSELTFSCNEGYDLIGSVKSTCLESGDWNVEIPYCQDRGSSKQLPGPQDTYINNPSEALTHCQPSRETASKRACQQASLPAREPACHRLFKPDTDSASQQQSQQASLPASYRLCQQAQTLPASYRLCQQATDSASQQQSQQASLPASHRLCQQATDSASKPQTCQPATDQANRPASHRLCQPATEPASHYISHVHWETPCISSALL